jgi:DNA-binding protein YbaB
MTTEGSVPYGNGPEAVRARVQTIAQQAQQRAQQFAQVRDQINGITVTERSSDGVVEVTVQASGVPTRLKLSEDASRLRPDQIAAKVMSCIHRAQARIADQVKAAVDETVPSGDPAARHIVDRFRAQFPEPPEESPSNYFAEEFRFGPATDSAPATPPPPPRPASRPRPVPDEDEGWNVSDSFVR